MNPEPIRPNKKNSVIYRLKGDKIMVPTIINLDLGDIREIIFYEYLGRNVSMKNNRIRRQVEVHFKGGVSLPFMDWYTLKNDEFANESIRGFSGSKDVLMEVVFTKAALL